MKNKVTKCVLCGCRIEILPENVSAAIEEMRILYGETYTLEQCDIVCDSCYKNSTAARGDGAR